MARMKQALSGVFGGEDPARRKTVKMQVKVANGRATPCGTAVTDKARSIIDQLNRKPSLSGYEKYARHAAAECLEHAKKGDWVMAVHELGMAYQYGTQARYERESE